MSIRITERHRCAAIIAAVTADLPRDMPLNERKAAVARACPHWVRGTANSERAWQAARRDYLVPFGYQPMTKKARQASADGMPLFDAMLNVAEVAR